MNTIGKILVVCNLLAAVAVGGFIAFSYVRRTNWEEGFNKLKRELEVSYATTKTTKETNTKLSKEIELAKADVNSARMKVIEVESQYKGELTIEQAKLEDALLKSKQSEINLEVALAEQDRLKEEVKGLVGTIANREKLILKLEDDNKRAQIDAVTFKNDRDTVQARNESLIDQVRRLQTMITEIQNRGVSGKTIVADPNAPNPPSTFVKGTVERIDPVDRSLVQISLGSDHGVNKNHTLEVYRTDPAPRYLGTIRIIDSYARNSVGKLVRNPTLQRTTVLQPGDIVSSTLGSPP